MVGLAVVLFFVALAVFAPWIAPHDPVATSWGAVRKAPSAATGSAPTNSAATCCRA